jgi:para-nitrobenzyl esterase
VRMQSRTGKSPAYLYYFTHVPPHPDAANQVAFHGSDIYYALGNLSYKRWAWTPIDTALADTMSSYWINFAATGNPNGPGLPSWPAYSEKTDVVMLLGDHVEVKANPRKAGLKFVDAANSGRGVR